MMKTYNLASQRELISFIKDTEKKARKMAVKQAKQEGHKGPVLAPKEWYVDCKMGDQIVEVKVEVGPVPASLARHHPLAELCYTVYLNGQVYAWVLTRPYGEKPIVYYRETIEEDAKK